QYSHNQKFLTRRSFAAQKKFQVSSARRNICQNLIPRAHLIISSPVACSIPAISGPGNFSSGSQEQNHDATAPVPPETRTPSASPFLFRIGRRGRGAASTAERGSLSRPDRGRRQLYDDHDYG